MRSRSARPRIDSTRSDAHEREISLVKAERDLQARRRQRPRERAAYRQLGARSARSSPSVLQAAATKSARRKASVPAPSRPRPRWEVSWPRPNEVHITRRALVEEQSGVVTEVRVRAAEAKQRLEGDQAAVERLQRSLLELDQREARLSNELREFCGQQGEVAGRTARDREQLSERVTRGDAAEPRRSSALKARYDEARSRLGEHEQALRGGAAHDRSRRQVGHRARRRRARGGAGDSASARRRVRAPSRGRAQRADRLPRSADARRRHRAAASTSYGGSSSAWARST